MLQGADYNKTLCWNSNEGIIINPFYTSHEKEACFFSTKSTQLAIQLYITSVEIGIQEIGGYIKQGVGCFFLQFHNKDHYLPLLEKVYPNATYLIKLPFYQQNIYTQIASVVTKRKLSVSLQWDMLGNFTRKGNWYKDKKQDFHLHKDFLNQPYSSLYIDSCLFQESGAKMIWQIACFMSILLSYELPKNEFSKKLWLEVGVGTNYFFEIAKLQAFRWVFESVKKSLGLNLELLIVGVPSVRELTLFSTQKKSS